MWVTFDAPSHVYRDGTTGEVLPSVTELIRLGGYGGDERWYTDEGRQRGSLVHRLAAQFDMGCLDSAPAAVEPHVRAYVLAYAQAVDVIRPVWSHIEEPMGHRQGRFAGTPDRGGRIYGRSAVCEIKTGALDEKAHGIQTALQAMLLGEELGTAAEQVGRYVLYLKPSGRWVLEEFRYDVDFGRARRLIAKHCRRG